MAAKECSAVHTSSSDGAAHTMRNDGRVSGVMPTTSRATWCTARWTGRWVNCRQLQTPVAALCRWLRHRQADLNQWLGGQTYPKDDVNIRNDGTRCEEQVLGGDVQDGHTEHDGLREQLPTLVSSHRAEDRQSIMRT